MYIVVTAYVLNENDITAGRKAIPIVCVRVGKMEKVIKDLYKRVYKDNGLYAYPKIAKISYAVWGRSILPEWS